MIFYRYIIREHILPFCYALGVIIFILLMQLAVQLLDKIISKGLDPRVVIELFLIQLGWIIALAVPMAILTSTLMTFGQMSSFNEITAIKSSGRNLYDLLVPVCISSIVIAVLLIYFNNRILPDANHRLANLSSDISRKRPAAFIEPGVLIRDFSGYALYVTKVNSRTGWLHGVKIFSDQPGEDPTSTVADSGHVCFTTDGQYLQLTLFNGESHTLSARTKEQVVARFGKQVIIIRNVDSEFRRTKSSYRGDREMSADMMMAHINQARARRLDCLREQRADVDSVLAMVGRLDSIKVNESAAVLHPATSRKTAASVPAARALRKGGIPVGADFSTEVRRKMRDAAIENASLPPVKPLVFKLPDKKSVAGGTTGKPDAPPPAEDETDPFITWISELGPQRAAMVQYATNLEQNSSRISRQIHGEDLDINQYLVEVHKKYAIPVTCLIFVLIGAPLGIMARRGGMAVGVSYSIFFFILFWACYIGGETLADKLILPAWIAMWSGNFIVGVCGIFLIMRMVRERSVFSIAPLVELWHRLTRPKSATPHREGVIHRIFRLSYNTPFLVLRPLVRTLPLYLIRKFIGFTLTVLIALVVVFTVLDYISSIKKFDGMTLLQVLQYYYYYLPWFIAMFLPIVILLATMFSVGSMARFSELTAMKGSGVSLWQLSAPLLALGILFSVGAFYFGETVLPVASQQRKELEDRIEFKRNPARAAVDPDRVEFRRNFYYFNNDTTVYYFREFWSKPARTSGVWRQLCSPGQVKERIEAESLDWDGHRWRFVKGTLRVFAGDTCRLSTFDTLADTLLHSPPEDMVARVRVREEMSYWELNEYIVKMRAQGVKVSSYLADLYFKIALPLMNCIVILLGVSITARAGRKGGAVLFGVGLAIVFSYWIISRFALAFAQSGQISPLMGAWFGNILFVSLGLILYRRALR